MKIIEIRGFNLSFPLAEPMGNALNVFRKRDALLIQIRTDSGLSGWGEAGNSPHAAGAFNPRPVGRAHPRQVARRVWPPLSIDVRRRRV